MAEHPFVKDYGGYSGTGLDHNKLLRELANELPGASFVPDSDGNTGQYSLPRLRLANGVMVTARPPQGRKAAEMATLSAYYPLEYRNKAVLPSITVNTSKPWATLVADIKRRLVDACAEPLAEILAEIEKQDNEKAKLLATIERYRKACPQISINTNHGDGTTADVYFNVSGRGYVTGTLYADGHMSFQRVSIDGEANALALFALLAGKGA